MVYRTKKLNRKRQRQRKSRKNVYKGGASTQELKQESTQEPTQESTQEPTLSSNVDKAVNVAASAANKIVSSGIESVGDSVGIDVNKSVTENVSEITDNLKKINQVLESPKGQELKEELGEVLKESLEVLKPSISEAEEIVAEGATKLTGTATNMVQEVISGLPPGLAVLELSNLVAASAQTGEMGLKLLNTGIEANEKLKGSKNKFLKIIEDGKELFSDFVNKGNQIVSQKLNDVQNVVDNYGKNVVNKNITMKNANNTFNKFNRQAQMIGGRINSSQSEFLRPYVKTRRNR